MTDLIIAIVGLVFFGLIDLAIWALAVRQFLRHRLFLRNAVRIEGRVVALRTSRAGQSGGGATFYHPIVSFEDHLGHAHRVSTRKGSVLWDDAVGSPMDVLMLPGRPSTAMVAVDEHYGSKVVVFLALGFAVPVVPFLLIVLQFV